MGMDITTAAYHNSYDVAKKETKRVGDRGSCKDGTIVSGGPKPPVRNMQGSINVSISKEARELLDGRVVKKPETPHEAPNAEKQNTTHFSNINDPNDHGFFTKIWDEDGNVVWDADWNNDVEQQKPEHGMPPHGAPQSGQLPHWTEISRDLAEHGFYKNMTGQEIDYLEGYLRNMRTADDLNVFADKHTTGDLRQYLKDLAKGYGNYDKGHSAPKAGQPPHANSQAERKSLQWTAISRMLADHGFYKNMTGQEIDYLEGYLRNMRSAKDLNTFADKHTSGDLREFLRGLVKDYANTDKGHMW